MDGLRIVRGEPDDEELAALVAALCAVLARRQAGEIGATRSGSPTIPTWVRDGHYTSAPGAWIAHRDVRHN